MINWYEKSIAECANLGNYHCMSEGKQFEYFKEISRYAGIVNHGPNIEGTYYASKRLRKKLLGY